MCSLTTHGRQLICSTFTAVMLALAGLSLPADAADFFNDFETDTAGWDVFGGAFDAVRVPNPTDGPPSPDAGWHATGDIPATNWGGYSSTFPTGGYLTSIDIFLDVEAGHLNDTRLDFSSAINSTAGTFQRDFVFNLGFYDDNTGPGAGTSRYVVSASNNAGSANSFPKNPDNNPVAIETTGWYTFTHRFRDNGSGILEVLMSIYTPDGELVSSWALSDPADIIGTTVGGNRYGWFVTNEFEAAALAFDNSLKHEGMDSDGDGIPDFVDSTPNSDFRLFVDVGSGPTTIENAAIGVDADGNTIQDLVNQCALGARNHGHYVICIHQLANELYQADDITKRQWQEMKTGAAKSDIGKRR